MEQPSETPQQRAIREYNEMTADMFDYLSKEDIDSPSGERVIAYFMLRIKDRIEKER